MDQNEDKISCLLTKSGMLGKVSQVLLVLDDIAESYRRCVKESIISSLRGSASSMCLILLKL